MRPDGARNKLPKSIELPVGMLDCNAQEAWSLVAAACYGVKVAR